MIIASLIPARSGSKSIKDKNIVDVMGKPMIFYAIRESINCKEVNATYVSSNSENYLTIASEFGAKTILRPEAISGDNSTTEMCIRHFLKLVKCDVVVLIQATSPLIQSEYISKAIRKMLDKDYDCMVSVHKDHGFWWDKNKPMYDPNNRPMRQNQKNLYKESGMFYIFKSDKFLENNCRIFGKVGVFQIPAKHAMEVDEPDDLFIVNKIMEYENENKHN